MYRITYELDLFNGESDLELSYKALQNILISFTQIDIEWLRAFPGRFPLIYKSGVKYLPEHDGDEVFKDIPTCLKPDPKYGNQLVSDCEDLSCWRAAELNVIYGVKAIPTFTHRVINGKYIYHVVVRYPNGIIEDPSRVLGMDGGLSKASGLAFPPELLQRSAAIIGNRRLFAQARKSGCTPGGNCCSECKGH